MNVIGALLLFLVLAFCCEVLNALEENWRIKLFEHKADFQGINEMYDMYKKEQESQIKGGKANTVDSPTSLLIIRPVSIWNLQQSILFRGSR